MLTFLYLYSKTSIWYLHIDICYTDDFVLYVLFCDLLFHIIIYRVQPLMSAHIALYCSPLGKYTKVHLNNPLLLDIDVFQFFSYTKQSCGEYFHTYSLCPGGTCSIRI